MREAFLKQAKKYIVHNTLSLSVISHAPCDGSSATFFAEDILLAFAGIGFSWERVCYCEKNVLDNS